MGTSTKMFGLFIFFSLFWLFFYWGHKFFPAYLACPLWAYMCISGLIHKDPSEPNKKDEVDKK